MKKSVRLSKDVTPIHYKVTMRPNLDDFTFRGSETIQIQINKPTKKLVLHAIDLKLSDAVWKQGKNSLQAKKISSQKQDQTATFEFASSLKGKGNLSLSFSGELTDSMRGYYKSSYQHKKETKHISVSQFEATDARRAFPSFDEPAHKAVFEVSLIVPEHHTAISNTIESSVAQHEPGYKIVSFTPSPKMSTYLLAFITGEFESIKTKTKDGVTIRVFTTPGKIKHAKFALDVAKRSLEYMNEYFAVAYPLPILDLIAIPDFAAGAMENWGAVTFRETALLIDEQHSPFISKERVAEVIAHELVHQWFGNLVTMEWWTHLWLNESFATYMAYKTIDHIFPEWKIETKFILNEQTYALTKDALISAQPVEVEVYSPDDISESFDPGIVYAKGASVLRMLENYIGDDNFCDGLRQYLKKHSYQNTSSVHLWEAFEKASKKPVQKLMKSWTTKSGYPVIKASIKGDVISLEQEKFKFIADKKPDSWFVPIQIQLSKEKVSSVIELQGKQTKHSLSPDRDFVKLNAGQFGYYRSAYDPSLLARLLLAARDQKLDTVDRLGLVNDLLSLAKGGFSSTDVFLEAIQIIGETEDSYVVWSGISEGLGAIHNLLEVKEKEQFASLVRPLYTRLINKLGWQPQKGETTAHSLLRAVAIRAAGMYNDSTAAKKSKELFAAHLKGKHIFPDLRLAVYATAAASGGKKEWDQLRKLYSEAEMNEERLRLGYAMTNVQDTKLAEQTAKFILSDAVRLQDQPLLVNVGFMNPTLRPMLWNQMQKNWDQLMQKFSRGNLLGHLISGLGYFSTEKDFKQISQFFKTHKPTGAELKVKQMLEVLQININWRKRDEKLLKKYLKTVR